MNKNELVNFMIELNSAKKTPEIIEVRINARKQETPANNIFDINDLKKDNDFSSHFKLTREIRTDPNMVRSSL